MKKIIRLLSMVLLLSAVFSVQAKSSVVSKPHLRHHSVASQKTAPVDINTADAVTLATLKGIGIKKAKSIVTYRKKQGNFKSIQDLAAVPGMGKKTLARLIKNNSNRLVINP